jgi:hypothetical protein
VRQTLTTGESDPGNGPGHAVGLQVAGYFAVEPRFGNRIKHVVCVGFSCGKQDVEEKTVLLFFTPSFRAKSRPSVQQSVLSIAFWSIRNNHEGCQRDIVIVRCSFAK